MQALQPIYSVSATAGAQGSAIPHSHANDLERIAPIHGEVFDEQVAETIARETGASVELATRIYGEELRILVRDARITQFVNVLASRRARIKLQQRRDQHRA